MSTSKHHKSQTYVSIYLPDKSTSTPCYPSNLTQANLNSLSSSPAQLAEFNPPVFLSLKTLKAFQLLLKSHTLLFTKSVDLTSVCVSNLAFHLGPHAGLHHFFSRALQSPPPSHHLLQCSQCHSPLPLIINNECSVWAKAFTFSLRLDASEIQVDETIFLLESYIESTMKRQ